MPQFFTRQRFGRPQFLAGALLLVFLAQALWLVNRELVHRELAHRESHDRELDAPESPEAISSSASEQVRIAAGWRQIHGEGIAGAPFPDSAGSLPTGV